MKLGLFGATILCASLAPAVGWSTRAVPQDGRERDDRPRLLVVLVVDQFRADYIPLYGHQWTKGLRRLVDEGANFPLAAYPYAGTKTCPGHFTIGTGTFPRTHGMIDNAWFDRDLGRSIPCTDDPAVWSVPFGGGAGGERHSARMSLTPTLAEQLRLQSATPPRIVSMSLKPRSAIGLAGRPGPRTMVLWHEDNGTWATSSAYASAPWPEVEEYVASHPIAAALSGTWTKTLPDAAYLFDDQAPGEIADGTFPHPLAGPSGTMDATFIGRWQRSPWSDAYLGGLAGALATSLHLGQGPATDMLAVSFSALDLAGHAFGPRSHEVQDVLVRLDGVIGDLLTTLDTTVGTGRYVVALTADHGVPPLPDQAEAVGVGSGRFTSTALRNTVETALDEALGAETWVANVTTPFVYFTPSLRRRVVESPRARDAVARALRALPGVQQVYWANEIVAAAQSDAVALRLQGSFMAERSGDLAIVATPYWVPQATGTTHGSPHTYDRAVPLVLYGMGIESGRYLGSATPADIAPTLAYLTGIQLAAADGRVLSEALVKTRSVAPGGTNR